MNRACLHSKGAWPTLSYLVAGLTNKLNFPGESKEESLA